jgi:hypothetical protein
MIGQRKMLLNVIEIWFCLHVREQLAFIGRYSLQKYREMRKPFQEAFVIVGVIIISSLMQTLEAPTNNLASERFIFALPKVFRHDVPNKKLFIVYLPYPTMWLDENEIGA